MQREPETELMEDKAQVEAYARADFSLPHQQFIDMLSTLVEPAEFDGIALELGCGPGDISRRFVKAYPFSRLYALDGSKPMLDYANALIDDSNRLRLTFIHGKLPDTRLPLSRYDLIFSNSLLHHLPEPGVLWQFIKRYAQPGARVAVMDLLRPETRQEAKDKVACYANDEPEILQRDFYQSLLAAFTLEEIHRQLHQACLDFTVTQSSDRHVFITGRIP